MSGARVAVVGGTGKTGLAVTTAVRARGAEAVPLGRAAWIDLTGALAGADAVYVIAPNMHHDEAAYVESVVHAARRARVGRLVLHSVASPYVPAMPHHLGKAQAEDVVRRSELPWTILQPGAYLQNLDLSGPEEVEVPYDVDSVFGFLDLGDLGAAAATVLLDEGHAGATYELASRVATVREIAAEAGLRAVKVRWSGAGLKERERAWLQAMFHYYDRHGLPVGTLPLRALLA